MRIGIGFGRSVHTSAYIHITINRRDWCLNVNCSITGACFSANAAAAAAVVAIGGSHSRRRDLTVCMNTAKSMRTVVSLYVRFLFGLFVLPIRWCRAGCAHVYVCVCMYIWNAVDVLRMFGSNWANFSDEHMDTAYGRGTTSVPRFTAAERSTYVCVCVRFRVHLHMACEGGVRHIVGLFRARNVCGILWHGSLISKFIRRLGIRFT